MLLDTVREYKALCLCSARGLQREREWLLPLRCLLSEGITGIAQ